MVDYEKLPSMSALIWPSKQAERINREEQASYSIMHNGRLRKASTAGALIWPNKQAERIKAEDWFDPASRQLKSKQKNMQVIHPSTMVD